jgi:hypothetical protein
LIRLLGVKGAREPEISHLHMTLRVKQEVAGLQVSVQQIGRVHELQAFEDLVDNILLMNVLQDVRPDNCMQICVHKIEDEVYISIVLCTNHILKSDDIFMTGELLKENDLSERSLCIRRILKCIKVLL